ncbi:MAG TPA: 2-oxoglutarate dehydrogenase complex dihydrolipoyllysine-residue succinyltransferase [Polyangiaceae bacterium]|jgi:2-oxoglutarate dehydrogenase E2 component (dihydrolipoamide succinyltransferase)|nr:2-oxoglutarate dehydrogenase complex dihydrolipoyllysine-residue succinyltransferase [Polyangiaceae bacterium]
MAIELKVPTVGESITEVQIGEWLKAEGEAVSRDEIIARIETDKVTVDFTAPSDGVLTQIKVKKGQTAAVGDVIGLLEEGAAASASAKAPEPAKAEPAKAEPAKAQPAKAEPAPQPAAQEPPPKSVRPSIPPQGFARVMPSARRALKERGLSPDDVEATGPGGRVLKEDVDRLKEKPAARPAAPANADRAEEIVAMSPFRKRIAERLVQSQQTAALLTTFNEVDMSAVMELRKTHQEAFQEKYGIKLGFMSFFVKAAIEALKLIPAVNGEIRGSDVVYKNYYDIGVAVGGGKGLAVPVIRNAERLSFAEVEQTIADFGKRAKDNKLELHELTGGTFTVSNGGIYGSMLSTPIVNPPQSGILGLHAIQDRPMAVKGQVVIRPMMYIALTYDHRLVDGREAVTFLKRIKQCMEEPARILLEV